MKSFTIIAPAASNEAQFYYTYNREGYLFVSQFAGLALGSLVWPIMADYSGRSWIFTSTLALAGVGGLVGAGMPAYTGLCILGFIVGAAIGGNQAVDAMLLIESLPVSHHYLLAMQGAFFAIGTLVASLIGWTFTEQYTCGTYATTATASTSGSAAASTTSAAAAAGHTRTARDVVEVAARQFYNLAAEGSEGISASGNSSCHYVSNKGWRYIWWTFGCITLFFYLLRFLVRFYESPKYLAAQGRDAEAAQVVKDIALVNKSSTFLAESHFAQVNSQTDETSVRAVIVPALSVRIAPLVFLWAVIGITYPIWTNYIETYIYSKGVLEVTPTTVTTNYLYKRYVYIALAGIPGPIVAAVMAEVPFLGRKFSGLILSALTGIFMFVSVTSRSDGAWLGWSCVLSFLYFAQIALLFLFTVECIPTPTRGHGLGLNLFVWRFFGMIAAIVTAFAGTKISAGAPVYVAGALSIVAAGVWVITPRETRAKAAQ
jgi:MFS family permease